MKYKINNDIQKLALVLFGFKKIGIHKLLINLTNLALSTEPKLTRKLYEETAKSAKKTRREIQKIKQKKIIEENHTRLAKMRAARIMRKSLNKLSTTTDSWLVARIREICQIQEKDRSMHSFCFENSHEAAAWNAKVLESYDNDYQKAVENQPNTTISPGSEFRAVEHIEKIWGHREDWENIKDTLMNGCSYPLKTPLDEKTRLSDLKAMIDRGNHKSCEKPHLAISLDENIEKEVNKAFQIPLPVKYLIKLKNAYVIPMGMSEQFSINEKGEKIMKPRPCHDASFPAPSGYSVNNDHDLELLSACQYGQCLRRVIHSIHRIRHFFTISCFCNT